jgi:GT2 family glycosyltransferase
MTPPPFTVVTVLHDSAAPLRALLASLAAHHDPPPPVVAADSGSRDDGAHVARAAGATVVDLPGNPGFGAANNAALERVTTPVTVLCNPDVEVRDDALSRLAAAASAQDALHVPRLVGRDGRVEDSAHPVPGGAAGLVAAVLPPRALPRPARERLQPWRAAPGAAPRRVGWAIAACVAARTQTLRELGPFDPAAFLFYEDLDLCLRAAQTGRPTILHPGLTVVHAGRHSTGPALGPAHEQQARRRREVVRARLGTRALALDDAAQALTFATRAAVKGLAGAGARERAQLRALRAARR